MATISIFLKKSKTTAKGDHPVVLRLADSDNKRAYFSTGFYALEKQFDESNGRFIQGRGVPAFNVVRKEDGGGLRVYTNKEANDKLSEIENRARTIIQRYNEDHIDWGFEQFRADFTNAPKRNLFKSFAESIIDKEYELQGRFKKAIIAREALDSLERYDKALPKKSIQDITASYIQGYMKHCQKLGNTNNTIGIRLREIRRFYNLAVREKLVSPELYPFSSGKDDGKARIPKTEQNKTDQYLPLESMQKLATAMIDNPFLDRTRHLFLFSYYCRGINWKDMALLRKSSFYKATVTDPSKRTTKQVTMMQYKRSKTKGAFDIQVTSSIQAELDWFKQNTVLFEDYVLPIVSIKVEPEAFDEYIMQIRKRFNRSLKKLAKEVGLPESQQDISIYSARHSFAMTLQDKGKPVEIISQALGHQSIETTKHYLAKFSTTRMAEETDIDLFATPAKQDDSKEPTVKEVSKPQRKQKETKKAPTQ